MIDSTALIADPAAQAAALAGESVVPGWASDSDSRLLKVVADLDRIQDLRVFDVEFDHYGSGYASSVEVKMTRRDDQGVDTHGGVEVEGFGILLCRLAPLASLQATAAVWRRNDGLGSSGSLPCVDNVIGLPVPGYPEARQVEEVLGRHGYGIADPSALQAPIAAGLEPGTNFGESPWCAFDAWFYWYD